MAEVKQNESRNHPPLSIEEIVARDNSPALKPVPHEIAAQLATHSIFLSGTGISAAELQKALQTKHESSESLRLSFPSSVVLGQLGNIGERVTTKSLVSASGEVSEGKSFRPDWAPLIYHPKLSAKPRKRLMQGARRKVIPVNQEFIYGSDDRVAFYPGGYPWHCIGKVDVFPNASAEYPTSWGSGVLIGDRLVLTAGHVPPVNPPSGQWKMRFSSGLYNGSPVDGPGAISYVSDFKGYLGGVSGIDYAILRLYNPIGSSLGYFGWKTYNSSWDGGDYWWLAGYPYDIAGANSPSYQSGIAVLDEDSNQGGLEIEHQGDVASGDSGGPFWGFWADGFPYVVGTCSGNEVIGGPSWTGGEDNNIAAGGGALSNLLSWGRSNWPL